MQPRMPVINLRSCLEWLGAGVIIVFVIFAIFTIDYAIECIK